ncbi:MAG: hypothetical protein HKP38_03490 [Croceitalea sp.]|nr:hypothetical protein [Croceitalea sp.]MBT8237271.1 hypothetical protein [Croceitalea sp.]NNC35146.1 hypothetical protein [Croceitalea sp.]NNL08266.1 hypothetical protein [Croceitalea sp.]NNM19270.1 hypothetical protein [Croceitalea sp.]
MKRIELNQIGNFDPWDGDKIRELKDNKIAERISDKLLFGNEEMNLWEITLEPNARLPFRLHQYNYSWTCLTGGMVLSRFDTGKIELTCYEKGESAYCNINQERIICDLENIGEAPVKFTLIEYKNLKVETPPRPIVKYL